MRSGGDGGGLEGSRHNSPGWRCFSKAKVLRKNNILHTYND